MLNKGPVKLSEKKVWKRKFRKFQENSTVGSGDRRVVDVKTDTSCHLYRLVLPLYNTIHYSNDTIIPHVKRVPGVNSTIYNDLIWENHAILADSIQNVKM